VSNISRIFIHIKVIRDHGLSCIVRDRHWRGLIADWFGQQANWHRGVVFAARRCKWCRWHTKEWFSPLNAEWNPICHFLALLWAHPIFHVSRIKD